MAPRGRVSVYRPQLRVPVFQATPIPELDVSSGIEKVASDLDQAANRMRATRLNEARLDATTRLEELQLEAQKQPWQDRQKFFEDGASTIRKEIEQQRVGSDGVLRGAFAEDWGKLYLPRNTEVKYSVRKGEIDHNQAVLDQTMTVFSRQAAQATDERQARFIRDQAAVSIAEAQNGGFLTETEAGDRLREFARGVERNRARALIEANPNAGVSALQDLNNFQNLREEDRLTLVSRAESKLQHRAAMADHAAVVNERNRRIAGDQLAKEGWDLVSKGTMTSNWLDEAKRTLDASDYHAILNASQSGGSVNARNIVADAYQKLYVDGEDVSGDVIGGLRSGTLTPETAKSLLEENKQTQGIKSPARMAREYVASVLKVSDLNPAPGAPERLAAGVNELDAWLRENPRAGATEVDKKAKDIGRRYAILNRDEILISLPLPQSAIGDRQTGVDIAKTRAAITKKFLAKYEGDKAAVMRDPEFIREAKNLKLWEAAQNEAARALAAAEAAKKSDK